MPEARLQMCSFEVPELGWIDQYRYVSVANGFGGRWKTTPYLAWVDWRRLTGAR